MVISVWMIGALWLFFSTLLYIFGASKMFGESVKNEGRFLTFMMCVCITEIGALLLYFLGFIIVSVFNLIISENWISFFNHEVIYINKISIF